MPIFLPNVEKSKGNHRWEELSLSVSGRSLELAPLHLCVLGTSLLASSLVPSHHLPPLCRQAGDRFTCPPHLSVAAVTY